MMIHLISKEHLQEEMAYNKPYIAKLWLMIFFYTLLVGLFVQLVLLPVLFPYWHGGDGLLIGGDWLEFQRIAVELTAKIEKEGWSLWELMPAGQAPAGIAAAIYTLTGISKPWIILPLNAALHASSAIVLLLIVITVTGTTKLSVWPVLPFIFFPTALLWNTQIHKDNFFILGSYIFLYGFLLLTQINEHRYLHRIGSGFPVPCRNRSDLDSPSLWSRNGYIYPKFPAKL
jgi:hypothetical protein